MLSELLSLRAHSAKELTCPNSIPLCLPLHDPLLVFLQFFSLAFSGILGGGGGMGGDGLVLYLIYPLYINHFLGFVISPLSWTTTITSIQITPKSDSSQKHISNCIDVCLPREILLRLSTSKTAPVLIRNMLPYDML